MIVATLDDLVVELASQPSPSAPASISDLAASLGMTTASNLHAQPLAAILDPAEYDQPLLPMCTYTEYDSDTGETYRCGLGEHSFKVKHTRGARV